jgi:hypothetical protein
VTTYDEKMLELLVKGRDHLARPYVELHQVGEYFGSFWRGGTWRTDPTRCCGMGAVFAGSGLSSPSGLLDQLAISDIDVHDRLRAAIPADCPPELDFYEWNDRHAQSKDDVIAVFDRAIANLRAEVTS